MIDPWHEFVGNIHMHTRHSDGTGEFVDLIAAARTTGLDFIVVTDHNLMKPEEEGYHGGLLVLVGAEIHDEHRQPPSNHLLCLAIEKNPVGHAHDPQALIRAVHSQGGMAFLAHPFERTSRLLPVCYPWQSWEVDGYQGIELWNYMSEFRFYATSKVAGVLISYLPAAFSTGPWPETLAHWDALTQTRPIVAIGGSDAHARTYSMGLLRRMIFPYRHCFRAVNTHLLLPEATTGQLAVDRQAVYAALAAGHCWIGYDLIGNTAGFRFSAESGGQRAIMGDTLQAAGPVTLQVRAPDRADLCLLHNGRVIGQARARELSLVVDEPGVYRAEAWRRAWFKPRGWIFSNPIYVT